MSEFEKTYDPKKYEDDIYRNWEASGFFNPDQLPGERTETYSIVLPPPNVTGTLHMGHAAMLAIEDILIRYHRMQGKKTLWVPGTDHAAIATQEKVEKELYKKDKKTRHDLGREVFLKRVENFAIESHDTIVHQMKRMGASLDWSREAFTLDQKRNHAVNTAFQEMYEAGLIYRGDRIVNWDPKLQTTVSDDEVEWKEEKAPFYYIQYGPFVIGTARPETKFGDKYVVMHPNDERYKKYKHGDTLEVPWINGTITATIIKDEAVDPEFGTGVMTITPWHDAVDFEIAERHNLDKEQIIDLKGKLLPIAGEFAGQHISKARSLIVQKLEAKKLLVKVDDAYAHRIAVSSRGGGTIEPQIMRQWFVDVNKKFPAKTDKLEGIAKDEMVTLKEMMLQVVRSGQIRIVPERFEKIYFHWIENLRDWCISRQLWYGHRIPAWYKEGAREIYVGEHAPSETGWVQDEDTLDTWFSSGLWTFSTLGWPGKTKDLDQFHPTDVLETGYDILFFWIARMVLMGGFLLGDIPFKTVYLHGLVRDEKGRKMSKSLGNGIDPLEMADKYGADATRLSLIIGAAPGNDVKLSEDKIRGYRNFATKIWNIARFIAMYDDATLKPSEKARETYASYYEGFEAVKASVTKNINAFMLHEAAHESYHYIWHTFADIIIEEVKSALQHGSDEEKAEALTMLKDIFLGCLKLLHPFMPFVTEAVYQKIFAGEKSKFLMIEAW